MNNAYPWFADQWAALHRNAVSGRLSHALLLSARASTGIEAFASDFAQRLLCESLDDSTHACGTCRSCHLYLANSHPDFKLVAPAEEGKGIGIDQIRELSRYYSLKPHYDRGKITLISPANAMNNAAANALLKVLEEPPEGAVIILVAHRFSAMPMTIRSRCVRVACEQIDIRIASDWLSTQQPELKPAAITALLRQSGGAPLAALALAADESAQREPELLAVLESLQQGSVHPLTQSKAFADMSLEAFVQLLTGTVSRLIYAKFACPSAYDGPAGGVSPRLQGLVDHLNLKHLYTFLDLLFETKALLARQSGLREADIVETLWLGLARAAR